MSNFSYTGLEPHVPLTQAQAETYLASASFGVSFNNYDLNWMLNYDSATPSEVPEVKHGSIAGIRLYEGVQPEGEDTILGCGVHESSYDVRGKHPYLRSNGNNIDGYATRLTRQVAIEFYLKYGQDSDLRYHVYFSQKSINNILAKENVLGIRFYSIGYVIGEKSHKTFMMVGVHKNKAGVLVDRKGDNEYVISDKPCPPFCHTNGGKALFSAS